ncbi:MAG: hypothetical protein RDU14_10965 [Melioribacteraceae bacterium]|jgi:hypothetical protein|nr:hypothetical protein [Melioribacteraceae bacterium]
MELIEIIYDVAALGVVLLFFVVLISYIFSKINQKSNSKVFENNRFEPILFPNPIMNYDQALIRRNISNPQPLIFHVDQIKNKELKIIRKPTVSNRDIPDFHRESTPPQFRSDNVNSSRYTIVNEDMSRYRNPHVVNF